MRAALLVSVASALALLLVVATAPAANGATPVPASSETGSDECEQQWKNLQFVEKKCNALPGQLFETLGGESTAAWGQYGDKVKVLFGELKKNLTSATTNPERRAKWAVYYHAKHAALIEAMTLEYRAGRKFARDTQSRIASTTTGCSVRVAARRAEFEAACGPVLGTCAWLRKSADASEEACELEQERLRAKAYVRAAQVTAQRNAVLGVMEEEHAYRIEALLKAADELTNPAQRVRRVSLIVAAQQRMARERGARRSQYNEHLLGMREQLHTKYFIGDMLCQTRRFSLRLSLEDRECESTVKGFPPTGEAYVGTKSNFGLDGIDAEEPNAALAAAEADEEAREEIDDTTPEDLPLRAEDNITGEPVVGDVAAESQQQRDAEEMMAAVLQRHRAGLLLLSDSDDAAAKDAAKAAADAIAAALKAAAAKTA